jgi:hypothetical protein
MNTSASDRARRRWNKLPMSFQDIDQLPTRAEKAAAFVAHFEHIERLERAKRRPNRRLLAKIEAKKRPLELIAAGAHVSCPDASKAAQVIPIAEADAARPAGNGEPRKEKER